MKVVILCGGQGTRLREETEVRPKPMVEIGGAPIPWHIIKDFFLNYEARMKDVTVRLGNLPAVKVHNCHDEEGWTVTMAETGETSMTGARVRRSRKYLDNNTFCLTYGDGLGDVNLRELIRFHKSHGKLGTVTGVRPPGRFGELELEGNKVTG